MYSYPSFGKSTSNATSSKDLPPLSEMRRYSFLIATKENPKARVINIHLFPLRLFQWRMMHDAWSMFHSLRCIMGASLVNYVPPTSLETKTANATDASMLCQQNVKTMYFQALNPRLFKTLFTWSGGTRSSGVGFFCFVAPRAWKQKKSTPLDRGPPHHINRP